MTTTTLIQSILEGIITNKLKLSVSQTIKKLASAGYLQPHTDNGKTVYYKMTDIGKHDNGKRKLMRCYDINTTLLVDKPTPVKVEE